MAFDARSRVNPAVNFGLTDVIATMGKITLGITGKLFAWFKLILAGMAIIAEGFVMARSTGIP